MKTKGRSLARLAAVAAIAVLAAACGASPQGGESSGSGDGVLRIGHVQPLENWDPLLQATPTYLYVVYDTLLRFAPDGHTLQPDLATEWELTSDHLTLTLREGVTFHDGTAFDADAVIANLKRIKTEPTDFKSIMANVENITAPGKYEVRLTLSAPQPNLLLYLALEPGSMISPKALQDGSFKTHPVGTGPWKYDAKETVPGSKMVFDQFTDYWDSDNVGPKSIVYHKIVDPQQLYNALRTDQVDVIYGNPVLSKRAKTDGYQTVTYPKVVWALMFLDIEDTFADPRLRKAMCHAVDTSEWLAAQFQGEGETYSQRFREGAVGHNPDVEGYQHDLDKARELMAELGNPKVQFSLPASNEYAPVSEVFKQQVADIGVDVSIDKMPFSQYINVYNDGKSSPVVIFSPIGRGAYGYYKMRFSEAAPNNPQDVKYAELDRLARDAAANPGKAGEQTWAEFTEKVYEQAYDCAFIGIPGYWIWDPEKVQNIKPTDYVIDTFRYKEAKVVG